MLERVRKQQCSEARSLEKDARNRSSRGVEIIVLLYYLPRSVSSTRRSGVLKTKPLLIAFQGGVALAFKTLVVEEVTEDARRGPSSSCDGVLKNHSCDVSTVGRV